MAVVSSTASAATVVNIDFNATDGTAGTYFGTGVSIDTGTTWNGLPVGPETLPGGAPILTFTSGSLVTSTGASTPITFSLGDYKVYEADENPALGAPALMTDFVFQQNLGPSGPSSTFSISNLDRAFTYDLYLYAQNGGYGNTATIFSIGGNSQTATNTGNSGSFAKDENYVLYEGVAPVAGGIQGTFNSAKLGNNAAFNGLQIVQRENPPPPPPSAAARTINVDFSTSDGTAGPYAGAAVAPNSGTIWNGLAIGPETDAPLVPTFTSGALVASNGSNTPVTVTLGNFRAYEADEKPAAIASALLTDYAYNDLVGPDGPDSTFSIANLDSAFTYDLYLFSQNGDHANATTSFTINGLTKFAANPDATLGSFVEDVNYVLFSGLAPDAFGAIAGTFNSEEADNFAAFNGFQLVQVPEPTALSILPAAGLLALRRRRL